MRYTVVNCPHRSYLSYRSHLPKKSTYLANPTHQRILEVCPIRFSNDLSVDYSSPPETPISISSEITYKTVHNRLTTKPVCHTFDLRVNPFKVIYFIEENGASQRSNKPFRVKQHYLFNLHLYMKYKGVITLNRIWYTHFIGC